jgi:radical SAM protein with 4Fe4S-binding SPASM domain
MRIQYQVNGDALLAALPGGGIEFLDMGARPLIEAYNRGGTAAPDPRAIEAHVITDPVVDLEGFHLAAPVIAFVEVTNLCNLRCKHCYASSGYRRPNELTTPEILGLLDELADMGTLQVFLTGGELFAHRDAVEIVKHARSKPFHTQIFTNGLLLTDEKLAALPPGTSFNISFDTADPERTVRGRMDYPRLRWCFEAMKRHGHVFRTAVSVHRDNLPDVLETFEWCARHGYPRPQWQEIEPLGRALKHPEMFLRADQVEEALQVYRDSMLFYTAPEADGTPVSGDGVMAEMHAVDTVKFAVRLENATGQEKCARSFAYVRSNGDVFPCSNCMSADMFAGGNIREAGFGDVWRHGFDEFREISFDDFHVCDTCPVKKAGIWCQFRCPPVAHNISGNLHGCGASDYTKQFMLATTDFWRRRREEGLKLTLMPPCS